MTDPVPPTKTPVLLQPRDPLIFRDARPFGADPGARAFSLTWPLPRSLAGAIRTHVIASSGGAAIDWREKANAERASRIGVHGPLLAARAPGSAEWRIHVPAPKDLVPYRSTEQDDDPTRLRLMPLRPVDDLPDGTGCDLPASAGDPPAGASPGWVAAMRNVALRPLSVTHEVKPETAVPAFWSMEQANAWLATAGTDANTLDTALPRIVVDGRERLAGIDRLPKNEQVHVAIDPDSRTAREGKLFVTESLVYRGDPVSADQPALAMLCLVRTSEAWQHGSAELLPLGGERRLARISADAEHAPWPAVPPLPPLPEGAPLRLRLQLVTPAIFTHGWLPGWMESGVIPGLKGRHLGLRLVGVATDRRVAVSGWRLASRGERTMQGKTLPAVPAGPKKTLYAVPAGSVYFFELAKGEVTPETWQEIWEKLWLAPISDLDIHRDEGFGLVLPGIW